MVLKYCKDGNMRDYLDQHENHISCELKIDHLLQISRGLLHIHNSDKIHRDLHSGNILFDGTPFISGLGSCQTVNYKGQEIVYGVLSYVAPEVLRGYKYTKAADIYSFGIVMNEFMSEETPYNDDSDDQIYLTVNICKGSRPKISEYTPELLANLITKCWNDDQDKRPTIQEVVTTLKAMALKNLSSKQQIIQQFKLNYGLFLDGYSIKPSEQAVFSEDGDLDISLYEDQPLVYTFVNDRNSHINLLSFNSGDHPIKFNKDLQSSDISINFPVAEITYSADLLANFIESESYGHLFTKKILVGGKLFINDLISATSTQTDSFKFFLTWVYDSAKYSKENPFNNLTGSNFLAKIRTLDGEDLNTCEKLTNWMNNLYQNDIVDIISYNNLIPISELRSTAPSLIDEIDEKQPGVANFREKLSFYEWVGDSLYTNLTRWINEKHLIYGLIIDKHFELEISKEIAINFINIPNVDLSNKIYLKIINPTTSLEQFLISNNIFSTENVKNISSFPFNKMSAEIRNCKDYSHFLIKFEKYKIRFNNIIPSKRFKQAIENALGNMKPFIHLQNVFDEYGHFFPLDVVLGKSLKTILPNSSLSYTSEKIELEQISFESLIESLNSHLDSLNITYLLKTKGSIIEKINLSNWIQNTDDLLEVIEFDNVISLYDILEEEQKRKIDVILNKKNNLRIIMTGIEELKDLDADSIEHYKRINIKPSLEDENYEVFGSVISKNNLKLEDILIAFELYDLNGFSAMIKNLNKDVDVTECYILWIIIGNPLKLSIFSPRNREFQVDCVKKSITLQPNKVFYPIETFYKLSEGCTISVNAYCSMANYELTNIKIKFVGWSEDCIYFKIAESNYNNSNLDNSSNSSESHGQPNDDTDVLINFEVTICILSPHHEKLNVDNRKEKEYSLGLIGYDLTENTKGM
jgi:serine/threonine protein kinase